MGIRPALLVLLLLTSPSISFAQSYEWFHREVNSPHTGFTTDLRSAAAHSIEATEYGIYASGYLECDSFECHGFVWKVQSDDGELVWQRELELGGNYTTGGSVVVNALGVFVAGDSSTVSWDPETYSSFVRRYSHNGAVVWTLQDSDVLIDVSAMVIGDDGLYVQGSNHSLSEEAILRHISFDGDVVWTVVRRPDTDFGGGLQLHDGLLYAGSEAPGVDVYQTDGTFVRRIPMDVSVRIGRDGYFYGYRARDDIPSVWDVLALEKYTLDGDLVWSVPITIEEHGFTPQGPVEVVDDGLILAVRTGRVDKEGDDPYFTGKALVRVDYQGNVLGVDAMPGHEMDFNGFSELDGELYISGTEDIRTSFTVWGPEDVDAAFIARYSPKALLPPSVVALTGATPSMPPRLAAFHHDYGAGPVRVAIRDAAPESPEYELKFSDNLKPVSFDKVPDMNGNGYEEMVVVSRFPVVAEVRDSLDGRRVSRIQLGAHLEPVTATVTTGAGGSPQLAVVLRNESTDRLMLRVHDLASGAPVNTIDFIRTFEPVDVAVIPAAVGGRNYAVLAQNPVAGAPHKVEIRSENGTTVGNWWMSPEVMPIEFEAAGTAGDPALVVLRHDVAAVRPIVRQVYPISGGDLLGPRFTQDDTPVAMAVIPDTNNNGANQIVLLNERSDRTVRGESRDAGDGLVDYRVRMDWIFEPRDVLHVGAVTGFSASAVALAGWGHVNGRGWTKGVHVVLVDATQGGVLFELQFLSPQCDSPFPWYPC